MKKIVIALISFFIISSASDKLGAQWVQTNLSGDAQVGYNLYSNDTTLFACTLNGIYYTSSDGNPWFSIGPINTLTFDVLTNDGYIIAACEGSNPGIYISSDNGSNWNFSNAGLTNSSVRCLAKNSQFIFAGTWGGGVYRSSDNGFTWSASGLNGEAVISIYTINNIIFAGTQNSSKIYYSVNNGNSWVERILPYPASQTSKIFFDGSTLYACDMGLYASTDLGSGWSLRYGVQFDSAGTPIDTKIFKDITKYNDVLIASVAFEGIYISRDEGYSWNAFNEGLSSDWTFASIKVKPPFVWILRDFFGNAYRRETSQLTGIHDYTSSPDDFRLSQNYPNPFNPTTIIEYAIPQTSSVLLKVYNLLGQEVATLVDGIKNAGTYKAEWNASSATGGLNSGVYFYTLQAGSYTDTKKLILMK